MYYGLFVKVGNKHIRVDTTTGYTYDTAKVRFAPLVEKLVAGGVHPVLRKLPPVRQIDTRGPDKRYAKTPW